MPADPDKFVALVIASALTLVIFNIGGAVLVWLVWRSARRTRAAHPAQAPHSDPLAPLYYVLSLTLWPASLALCLVLLRSPRTARMGAICGTLGVAQVMAIAWLTCSTVVLLANDITPYLP